jgi:cytochrome c553
MRLVNEWRRPLVIGLAAAVLCAIPARAQHVTFAERVQLCGACHGEDGNSRMEKIPSLASQPAFFIMYQLFLMREGVRRIEAMAPMVKDLKDGDLDALSKHYARLEPKRSNEPIDPALVRRGAVLAEAKRCRSCHAPGLIGQDQIPRLAKQRIDYLISSMQSYRDGTRTGADTAMGAPVAGLSDADLAALAHYAASL